MTLLRRMRVLALTVILAGAAVPWRAEVSANTRFDERRPSTIMMDLVAGITDGADPIPQLRWIPYRKILPRQILNPSGAARRDGRPDAVFHPVLGAAFVTWAYNNGTEHDIAFAHWNGLTWTTPEFVTSDTENHIDPRINLSAVGGIQIVWAVDGEDSRILFSRRRIDDGRWSDPVRVTAPREHVANPTIAAIGDSVWVAYEEVVEVDGEVRPMITVREFDPDSANVNAWRLPTQLLKFSEPILHVGRDRAWLEWRFSQDQFAWIVLRGPLAGEPHFEPWLDRSWVGSEDVRKVIRGKVMGLTGPADSTLDSSGIGEFPH